MKRALAIAGLSFVMPLVVAPGDAPAADRPGYRIAVTGLPVHLDPLNLPRNVNTRFNENVFETLIAQDPADGSLHPGLAVSWRAISPTVLELKLREGVVCHNGEPFTADDVEAMFGPSRLLDPKSATYKNGKEQFFPTLQAVRVVDATTVHMETSAPDPLLPLRLAVDSSGVPCADALRAARNWEQWGLAPVGTGPYKVGEVRPGNYHRFDAFDRYWGKKAPLSSFTFKVVPEVGARISGLLAGEFDIVTEISPDQFKTISTSGRARVSGGPIDTIRILFFDTKNPALADPRVRRALSLAIDRQLIVDTLFGGMTEVPKGMQMKTFGPMYVDDHQPTGYDPARARALLKEAGYDGRVIEYRYMQDYYGAEVATAQVLQQMWKQVGLNVRLELKENWSQITVPEAAAGRGINNYSSTASFGDPAVQVWRTFGPGGPYQKNGFGILERFNDVGAPLMGTDRTQRRDAFVKLLQVFEQDPPGTYLHRLPAFYGVANAVAWKAGETIFMDFRAGSIGPRE
ncbi:ABC transporter substrate-binding protein [Stella sp.]|uniref:ABC transporter substrate-binding protein n=1 Tax=Stella sp. TaxID=2912054 RepID=UPI0035B24666